MSAQDLFIGIDVGSSSIKGAVLDVRRRCLRQTARAPFPDPVPGLPPGYYEIDPRAVATAADQVLRELLAVIPACGGVLMAGQMAGVVLVDQSGHPLTNYLSWRDQRVTRPHPGGRGSYFDVLQQRLNAEDFRQLGHEMKPGSAVSLLFWLAEQGRLPSADAVPLGICDFVWRQLAAAEPAMEFTQAIGTLNLETRDWHRGVFAKLGIDRLAWPALLDFTTAAGYLVTEQGRVPCYPGVGDHQSALAGAQLGEHELSINISTGSQVSLVTRTPQLGNYQTRSYFDGQFLNTLTHLPAGRSLNVLIDLLSELAEAQGTRLVDPWSYVAQAVAAVPETDLDVDLAFFVCPTGERGHIANISVDNLTVGSLFRAAFQNMAANYEQCALRLSPTRAWKNLAFSGGLVQKLDPLRQCIVRRFACPHRLCDSTEDTLRGLLALALVVSGHAANVSAAAQQLMAAGPANGLRAGAPE